MAWKPLIILSLLLVCNVLISSRHLEESTHKAEEKGAAHFGFEQVKSELPPIPIGYGSYDPSPPP